MTSRAFVTSYENSGCNECYRLSEDSVYFIHITEVSCWTLKTLSLHFIELESSMRTLSDR